MKSFPQTLLYSLLGCIGFAAVITLLLFTVQYHPAGVKPWQREAYARKMERIGELNEIAAKADTSDVPIAFVEDTEFDFGMVDPHTTLTHDFVVTNKGKMPLAVDVINTSCKCTLGSLDNHTLLPGETANVTLRWNTGYQSEAYEQTATLETNDPLRKNVQLKVSGTVKARFIAPTTVEFRTADAGEPAEGSFVVYSQLWEDFTITDVKADVEGFQWHAEPVELDASELLDTQANSAWRIRVWATPLTYGNYETQITCTAQPTSGGESIKREVAGIGKVRKPINFYHPEIHPSLGLDLGTLVAGKKHEVHLVVRARTDKQRKIEVLDVEPNELEASLKPLATEGSYRLTVRIPEDCPTVVFNANEKHGYVQVGDPDNDDFSNWFPLMGAVVTLE